MSYCKYFLNMKYYNYTIMVLVFDHHIFLYYLRYLFLAALWFYHRIIRQTMSRDVSNIKKTSVFWAILVFLWSRIFSPNLPRPHPIRHDMNTVLTPNSRFYIFNSTMYDGGGPRHGLKLYVPSSSRCFDAHRQSSPASQLLLAQ